MSGLIYNVTNKKKKNFSRKKLGKPDSHFHFKNKKSVRFYSLSIPLLFRDAESKNEPIWETGSR